MPRTTFRVGLADSLSNPRRLLSGLQSVVLGANGSVIVARGREDRGWSTIFLIPIVSCPDLLAEEHGRERGDPLCPAREMKSAERSNACLAGLRYGRRSSVVLSLRSSMCVRLPNGHRRDNVDADKLQLSLPLPERGRGRPFLTVLFGLRDEEAR